jgi:hypothetical protein
MHGSASMTGSLFSYADRDARIPGEPPDLVIRTWPQL